VTGGDFHDERAVAANPHCGNSSLADEPQVCVQIGELMKARPKLLFLGICAGAHQHLEEWCRTGVLPALHALQAKGLTGKTRSVPALFVQCTWPSFYTGTGPAHHAVLGSPERGGQASSHTRHPTLWTVAADQWHSTGRVGGA
jgi:predicted AlkP superfamily phosphohydrolase/phosphomutase